MTAIAAAAVVSLALMAAVLWCAFTLRDPLPPSPLKMQAAITSSLRILLVPFAFPRRVHQIAVAQTTIRVASSTDAWTGLHPLPMSVGKRWSWLAWGALALYVASGWTLSVSGRGVHANRPPSGSRTPSLPSIIPSTSLGRTCSAGPE